MPFNTIRENKILAEISEFTVDRGSYMSAHVFLNLVNKFGKRDKMRGLPNILSQFRNEFNKFNNTGARMLDCIYHMTLNNFEIAFFCAKSKAYICHTCIYATL